MCSRVFSFLELTAFLSIKVSDGYLGLNHYENVDFEVFLTRPAHFWYDFVETDHKCFHHQVFSYTHGLFVEFVCSVLIRMYLNITMKCFKPLISNISFIAKKKLIAKVVTAAQMLLFRFFDLNYDFFYEFFDLFSEVNGSDCYVMFLNKPKYGPYSGRKYSLQIITF